MSRQIRTAVTRFGVAGRDDGETWASLCECGDEPILASGHTVSRGEKARGKAKRLADHGQALQARAEQQVKRAQWNREDRPQ